MVILPAVLMLSSCSLVGDNASEVEIGKNGNRFIDGKDTGVKAEGNGIVSVEKTGSEGAIDTYTITFTDGTTETFTITNGGEDLKFDESGNTLTRDALKDIQGRIELSGTYSILSGKTEDNLTEKEAIGTIDVTYNEDAWDYTRTEEGIVSNDMTVYQMGEAAVVIEVDETNSIVYNQIVDSEMEEVGWDFFVNPLSGLNYHEFEAIEGETGSYRLRMEVPKVETYVNEILYPRLANLGTDSIEEVRIKLEAGRIATIEFESSVLVKDSLLGTTYSKNLVSFDVVATGDEAYQIPDIAPKETLPEHEVLRSALKELNEAPIKVTETTDLRRDNSTPREEADMSSIIDGYFTDEFAYLYNHDEQSGNGAIIIDGQGYNFTYSEGDEGPVRDYYPALDDEGNYYTDVVSARGDFTYIAPEVFKIIDDKHFEYSGRYVYDVAYALSATKNGLLYDALAVSIELDDNYRVKSITATDNYMFRCVQEFEFLEEPYELPFTAEDMLVGENPFYTNFAHKYTYTREKDGSTHEIVVKDLDDITVDGEAATDIEFERPDDNFVLTFVHEEAIYRITYFSSAEYWNMTIDYPDGVHEYYNDYWDGTLIIK